MDLDLNLINQFLQRALALEKTNVELVAKMDLQVDQFDNMSKSIEKVFVKYDNLNGKFQDHKVEHATLTGIVESNDKAITGHIKSHWQWFTALLGLIPGAQWLIAHFNKPTP